MIFDIFYVMFLILFYHYIIFTYVRVFETEKTKPVASKRIECLCYWVSIVITGVINVLYNPLFDNMVIGLSVTFVSIVILSFLHLGRVVLSAFCSMMIMASTAISSGIVILLGNILIGRIGLSLPTFNITPVVAHILLLIFVLIISRLKKTKIEMPMPKLFWTNSISVAIVIVLMLFVVDFVMINLELDDILTVVILIILIILFTNQGMLFSTYEFTSKLVEKVYKRQMAEEQNKYFNRQLDTMKEALNNYEVLRHDFRNKLVPLYQEATTGNSSEKLVSMLEELAEIHESNEQYATSGNTTVDSIINFKLHSAYDLGIKAKVKIQIPSDLALPTFDITNILGNILDNALEAVATCDDKWLDLNLQYTKGHLMITATNSFDGQIKTVRGQIVTRKVDEHNRHGLGLKSIQEVAKKYDGGMKIDYDNEQFRIKVVLFPEQQS